MLTAHILQVNFGNPSSVGDLAAYYAPSGYYAGGTEQPGVWFGGGAAALGLDGEVRQSQLQNLFLGRTPDGKRSLVQVHLPTAEEREAEASKPVHDTTVVGKKRKPQVHVPGYDLTFSVPKSVSALWALADAPTRLSIEAAFDAAVKEVLQWAEANLPFARRGKGGVEQQFARLVIGMFDHATARNNGDVDLHRHCVVMNLCQGVEDGEWSKVNSQMLLRWIRTLGPVFRNSLLQRLTDSLGVEGMRPLVKGEAADWFELVGVSEKLTDKWSSRRKEILKEAEMWGGQNASTKAKQRANLHTRNSKDKQPLLADLQQRWRQEASTLGVVWQSLQAALGRKTEIDVAKRVELAIAKAAERCTKDQAYFTRQKFIQRVSEELQDVPISGTEVLKMADQALRQRHRIVPIRDKSRREKVYTTKEMWRLEQQMLRNVKTLMREKGPTLTIPQLAEVHRRQAGLSSDQANAVQKLLTSAGSVRCLTGVAGAGKTKTLNAVKHGLELAGYRVIGTAISGAAKEELAGKANINTYTVASLEHHLSKSRQQKVWESAKHAVRMMCRAALGKSTWKQHSGIKLTRKTALFIDEAGMADTRAMNLLLQAANKVGALIFLIGDVEQLSPIGPGGPLKKITEMTPTAHLTKNFRQRHAPEDAQAAADLREGDVEKMLESYARRGKLTVCQNREKAARQLVTEWARDGGIKRPEQAIILTQTKTEARQVNRLCQAERQLAGALSRASIRIEGQQYHVGDWVLFHKPHRIKGIENGFKATITGFDARKQVLQVRLDREPSAQQKRRGHRRNVTIDLKKIPKDFLTLGYAATTHKMQGQSCERAYCLIGSRMTNKELTYVQITRGERETKLFTDRHHAGQKLADLAESIQKSGKKQLAHDLYLSQRLRKQPNSGE